MTALRAPTGVLLDVPPLRPTSLSEATLLRGYRGDVAPVVFDCACGETFSIDIHLSDAVQVGQYRGHLGGRRHRRWAGEEGS